MAKPDAEGRPKLEGKARRDFEGTQINKPLSRGARALLRVLLADCFRGYADCWHGNAALARMMGSSERSIQNWIPELEEAGILIVVDDDTIRSRRRIILAKHPDAPRLIAKLQANPSVRFDRTSGIHTSDNSQATTQNLPDGPRKICVPDHAKFSPESLTLPPEEKAQNNNNTPSSSDPSGSPQKEGRPDLDDTLDGMQACNEARKLIGEGFDGEIQDLVKQSSEELVLHVLDLYRNAKANKKAKPIGNPYGWIRTVWEAERGKNWKPPVPGSTPPSTAEEDAPNPRLEECRAKYAAMPPEDRQKYAEYHLDFFRKRGGDFRWVEDKGHWIPFPTAYRATVVTGNDMDSLKPEIRAILDHERSLPDWVNPCLP